MSVNPNFGEVIEFHSGPANSLYADWVGNIVSVRMKDGQTAWGLCMGVWVQCRELLSDESLVRNKSVIPISYEDRYRYSLTLIISARKTLGRRSYSRTRMFAREFWYPHGDRSGTSKRMTRRIWLSLSRLAIATKSGWSGVSTSSTVPCSVRWGSHRMTLSFR